MPGHLEPAFVRFFNRRAQLIASNVHVSFERSRAFVGPKIHHPSSVVWATELMHHRRERTLAFKIWGGDVHLRTDHLARVNQTLDFKIGEWCDASGGTNSGDAEGEV